MRKPWSEYLEGMVKLLNRPDLYRDRSSDVRTHTESVEDDSIRSVINECEDYLLARGQLDTMEAARDMPESEMEKNSV
ncbi:hypothetical protein GZ77_21910 [Endozoicomonas montiporae]|uniref:Uncharacterized protein n=2 Tax=Endozoicomonas montiporae TaxID=1027273 RepID=A0A081N3N8_9GAMM|nr:hypothetical protein [Endozoicomonas montiporae]AMO58380.1 hypothetical protein EZMO1_4465 [Endozoicomonas montiporae CL-33]KEQ13061.1 hypothetical protein GZ77_21910 [Endozoicomonas montiporae]